MVRNKKWSICTKDTETPHNVQWRHIVNKKGNVQTTYIVLSYCASLLGISMQ